MAALTDLSDVINRLTGGNSGTPEQIFFHKQSRVGGAAAAAPIAGRHISLWGYEGSPSHGVTPISSTGAALDNTTQGGLKQVDPGGGRSKWLLGGNVVTNVAGMLILYDRLAQDGGLDGTNTAAQTVSFTPPTRYSDGIGNQIWVEISTIIGTTGTTATCSYTDQDGNAGQTTPAFAIGATGLREAQRILPVPLAAGDYGVQNIANIDLVATTGTAGDFAILLVHPLLYIPVTQAGVPGERNCIAGFPSVVEIKPDACLALAWMPNTTTVLNWWGQFSMIEA